ncbi:MAG: hypothetical protein NUV56_00940, partial [Candidatus Uhrbacteria bacterium]|nr:hypothetical protein [Candidatus Uhrbacteria bacterium]
ENASDEENCVRFAVLAGEDVMHLVEFIQTKIATGKVAVVLQSVANPVLSKLKVNDDSRYV